MDKPAAPSRVSLVKAGTQSLEVSWSGSPSVQTYILQIQKYNLPPTAVNNSPKAPVAPAAAPVAVTPTPKPSSATTIPPVTNPTTQPVAKVTAATVSQNVPKLVSPVVRGKVNQKIK